MIATTRTNAQGFYQFQVRSAGTYVIRLAQLPRWMQVSPTFATDEPTGSYGVNAATGQPHTSTSWDYQSTNDDPTQGPVGPDAWSTIAPAGELPFQSPIQINARAIDLSRYFSPHYPAAVSATLTNTGAQIQAQVDRGSAGEISLHGEAFELRQFHIHGSAEHRVARRTFPMELHFVNTSADGAEAVVAVFAKLGAHNATLQPILDAATNHLVARNSTTAVASLDLMSLLPKNLRGWFYAGSLTTPPLSQVVNWLVLKTPITLSPAQLAQYKDFARTSGFFPNARPLQPSDGRRVNQFGINVSYQGGNLAQQDFTLSRRHAVLNLAPLRPFPSHAGRAAISFSLARASLRLSRLA